MKEVIMRFFKNEEGELAVEWAVLAGLIAVAIVIGVAALGTNLNNAFQGLANWIGGGSWNPPTTP